MALLTSMVGAVSAMLFLFVGQVDARTSVEMNIIGDWQVEAIAHVSNGTPHDVKATLSVTSPEPVVVTDERHDSIPEFIPSQPDWAMQEKFQAMNDGLCTAVFALDPASVKVRSTPGANAVTYEQGKDYQISAAWGAIGRIPNGRISAGQPVYISYRFTLRRLDSVVLTNTGKIILRHGKSHIAMPKPPPLQKGEVRLANIWVPATLARLTSDNLFPILETACPELPRPSLLDAERMLPKTMKKLLDGEPLKILAWGDSITEGYLGKDQWQQQFVDHLKKRFPKANITLVTLGWGAHDTESFLTAPPGHPCNYKERVLGAHADLIVSEFVNDAVLDVHQVSERYEQFLKDFKGAGTEWVIIAPSYISLWMGLTSEKNIDEDPRQYTTMIRRFAARNHIPLADASRRYGRLWRQGIPFSTLMVNTINHPDARGMAILSDSVMAVFP
jgi:hypothetical protein